MKYQDILSYALILTIMSLPALAQSRTLGTFSTLSAKTTLPIDDGDGLGPRLPCGTTESVKGINGMTVLPKPNANVVIVKNEIERRAAIRQLKAYRMVTGN